MGVDRLVAAAVGQVVKPSEVAHTSALVSEIWMLVDDLAGTPARTLEELRITTARGDVLGVSEILREVSDVEHRLADKETLLPYDRASMQIVRDSLNGAVYPASGLSIAYTAMVSGPLRQEAASRFALAQEAYSGLIGWARAHRRFHAFVLALMVCVTFTAVWESAKVALGKALLQNVEALQTQQVTLAAEKLLVELKLSSSGRVSIEDLMKTEPPPLMAYRICDRPEIIAQRFRAQHPPDGATPTPRQQEATQGAPDPPKQKSPPSTPPTRNDYGAAGAESAGTPAKVFATPEERDVCSREDVLATSLKVVRADLQQYRRNWANMVGFEIGVAEGLRTIFVGAETPSSQASALSEPDIEFQVAPVLLVWGNFVLPVLFSLIGSAIFVILDHYNKISALTLQPRDRFLEPVRLALGIVVGACVGLFFSAYGPVPSGPGQAGATLISSLSLTASGVAFLAGFGVETVFSMLQDLIGRVFKA